METCDIRHAFLHFGSEILLGYTDLLDLYVEFYISDVLQITGQKRLQGLPLLFRGNIQDWNCLLDALPILLHLVILVLQHLGYLFLINLGFKLNQLLPINIKHFLLQKILDLERPLLCPYFEIIIAVLKVILDWVGYHRVINIQKYKEVLLCLLNQVLDFFLKSAYKPVIYIHRVYLCEILRVCCRLQVELNRFRIKKSCEDTPACPSIRLEYWIQFLFICHLRSVIKDIFNAFNSQNMFVFVYVLNLYNVKWEIL